MKRILITAGCLLATYFAFAQDPSTSLPWYSVSTSGDSIVVDDTRILFIGAPVTGNPDNVANHVFEIGSPAVFYTGSNPVFYGNTIKSIEGRTSDLSIHVTAGSVTMRETTFDMDGRIHFEIQAAYPFFAYRPTLYDSTFIFKAGRKIEKNAPGGMQMNGATFKLDLDNYLAAATQDMESWTLISSQDSIGWSNTITVESISGSFFTKNGDTYSYTDETGNSWELVFNDSNVVLSVQIIPEASAYAAVFGVLALAFAAYRRRK